MDCIKVQQHLSAFMDGVLDAQTSTLVKKHLSACRECQRELESLKALVHDLGNLETVKAPDDFLEQFHKRMDTRFNFRKWIRTLFVPFRIKFPLELATAAAMAVLIFAIIYGLQMEKEISPIPIDKTRKTLKEKETEMITASAPVERKAELAEPAVKSARNVEPDSEQIDVQVTGRMTPAKGSMAAPSLPESAMDINPPRISSMKRGELVEFELLLKKRTMKPKSPSDPKMTEKDTMRTTDAKTIGRIALEDKKSVDHYKADRIVPEITTKSIRPGDEIDTWVLSPFQAQKQVEELITNVKGTVVYINYQNGTNMPQVIAAEIPANQYVSFYSQLQRIGSLRSSMPTPSVEGMDPIRIRIRFIAE